MAAPKLRFKAFDENWEKVKFSEKFNFHSTNSYSRALLSENGEIMNIHYGDIHTKFSMLFNVTKEQVPFLSDEVDIQKISQNQFLQVGDLVIADASEDYKDIGKTIEIVNLDNQKIVAGLHTYIARPNHPFALGFSGYLMQTFEVREQIKKLATGISVLGISKTNLGKVELRIPYLEEQTKIASFLSAVDEKITQLSQKLHLLNQYKQGMMQKLFSQQIRFKADDGSEFEEWEERKLSEISQKAMYGMNAAATEYDGINKYLRITDICEFSNSFKMDNLTSPNAELDDKYKLQLGDLLFARTGASVGKSYLYKENDGITYFAGFLIKFSLNTNLVIPYFIFLQTLTKGFSQWVVTNSMRSGQPGINAEEYSSYIFKVPCLAEQTKIANFLSSIDQKIDVVSEQLEQTKLWKKGLLQQMFV
ncbi:restriction endonuclease subunit S [Acinetobacter haemolyticus]|uniref:restriction endonuclease subunit S n=1 Tax=Acinetobacter haemolyticus TaxID=29430 RepID=UPI001372345A|nr:restriction endonuclease subunit S [Acinetobacter haemolyticus]NAR61024.1 restriction endonuclease subunit S [Acinetobacter haemolyticus]